MTANASKQDEGAKTDAVAVKPHDWILVIATENDAGSKDSVYWCQRCRTVRHDYDCDGRTGCAPVHHERWLGVAEGSGCTRGDMTEDAFAETGAPERFMLERDTARAESARSRRILDGGVAKTPNFVERLRDAERAADSCPESAVDTMRDSTCALLVEAADQIDALIAERDEARARCNDMHRRAQAAEAIAQPLIDGRPQGSEGRSLGRALANMAAAQWQDRAEAWEQQVDALRARVAKLDAVAEAARECAAKWEGAACIVTPPCGDCSACRLTGALSALDAAPPAASAKGEG